MITVRASRFRILRMEKNHECKGLQRGYHLLNWLVAALLIMSVSLADGALIALVASLVTVAHMIVIAFTVVLIDGGMFVTAWQMRRLR